MSLAAATTVLSSPKAAAPLAAALGPSAGQKVKEAAKEFESLVLGEVLKQSRQSLGQDGGLFAGDKGDVFGALFDFYLGQHLAGGGGLGLAGSIARELTVK